MSEIQMLMACKHKLYVQLHTIFGNDISIEALKNILHFSSVDAVVVAISREHLVLPLFGGGSLREKTVRALDVAEYIADQHAGSLNKMKVDKLRR